MVVITAGPGHGESGPPPGGGLGGGEAPGTSGVFVMQTLLNKKLPLPMQWNVLLSVATGSLMSYVVTRLETQKCSNLWVYLETGTVPRSPDEVTTDQNNGSVESTDTGRKKTQYGDIMD
ncbi:transmembrane protein 141-like isoform X1 [Rhincodon typus]|uniref:transmembrane protein 141 isoform X1 n=1 Tax=Rhincodon typus TaxID=259920 RepID=UPI00202F7A8E|nr:transmembrane protein 141 isoform X1 [Rhincodon typus]XP_048449674.1 transmembrane protein 141-like isoform X1 [Rhincodon typus]